MNLIEDAITYKRESGASGVEPTIPGLDEYRKQKKAAPSEKPVAIIDDDSGGDGDEDDDGSDEEKAPSIIKRSKRKHR